MGARSGTGEVFDLLAWDIWLWVGGGETKETESLVLQGVCSTLTVGALELSVSRGDDLDGGRTNEREETNSRIASNSIWTRVKNVHLGSLWAGMQGSAKLISLFWTWVGDKGGRKQDWLFNAVRTDKKAMLLQYWWR